jgi:hypothetical protein
MAKSSNPPRRSVIIAARMITLFVSLAGAEGMLWLEGYPQWWGLDPAFGGTHAEYNCDHDLGWSPRQGTFNLSFPPDPRLFRYTNWSGGRRATSLHPPPPGVPASQQVLFFGDSFIQGYGLSDPETLPWIVQQRHPELAVSNYGVGLYGTYQSYLAMKRSVHGPAAVYYLFNEFHEERNAGDPSFLRIMKPSPPGCFYPYVQVSGDRLEGGRSDGDVVWFLSRHVRLVAMVQEYKQIFESHWRVRVKRQTTQRLLVEMNRLVNAQGGKFTVILFDMDAKDRPDYRRFLEAQHIAYVDCERPELHDPKLRQPDQHPSKALNQLLAEWIEPIRAESAQTVSVKYPVVAGKTQ